MDVRDKAEGIPILILVTEPGIMIQDDKRQATSAPPDRTEVREEPTLAKLLLPYAPYDGAFDLPLPGLAVSRASQPYKELVHGLHKASLCLIAQGSKTLLVGAETLEYDPTKMLVASVDVPVAAQVMKASPSEPYLCMKLDLDPQKIAELALRVFPHGLPQVPTGPGVFVCPAEPDIVKAFMRLMGLLAKADHAELIAPLVVDEILIRLLQSPIGARVAQLGKVESKLQRISKAVSLVRSSYDQTLDVERLASMVNMSISSFHMHFKSVTSMSPLHYQKVLRLQEARRLILLKFMDAGTASRQVGYASPSQFSREYRKFFGHAPAQDLSMVKRGIPPQGVAAE